MSLNKRANLAVKRAAAQQAAQPPPLDPPFPYRAKPFDSIFFKLRTPKAQQ